MRPPQKTGEKRCGLSFQFPDAPGFNEAPAKNGGKDLCDHFNWGHHPAASMRPPQKTGEKLLMLIIMSLLLRSFNEAPAKNGGKGLCRTHRPPLSQCFNEAPAKNGGKGADDRADLLPAHELQ